MPLRRTRLRLENVRRVDLMNIAVPDRRDDVPAKSVVIGRKSTGLPHQLAKSQAASL
jgi:hypothetical protein